VTAAQIDAFERISGMSMCTRQVCRPALCVDKFWPMCRHPRRHRLLQRRSQNCRQTSSRRGVQAAAPVMARDESIDADASFSSLVGVPSIQQGTLLRVEANDSANSYRVHKLEGAPSITVPLGGAPLDPALIAQVKSWIDAGAAR
jgi:hypothetical protein